jgi:hypothetical protein
MNLSSSWGHLPAVPAANMLREFGRLSFRLHWILATQLAFSVFESP